MYKADMEELYHVCWRPQPASMHPLPNPLPPAPAPHSSAQTHVATSTPKKAAGAYRPPHARGSETPLHFKREDEGGAAHIYASSGGSNGINGFGKSRRREVPGAASADRLVPGAAPGGGVSLVGTGAGADEEGQQLSKSALKNKKKREAAKKAKEGQANGSEEPGENQREGRDSLRVPPSGPRPRSRGNYDRRARSKSRAGASPPPGAPSGPKKQQQPREKKEEPKVAEPEPVPNNEDKKVRALLKKLRAIEDLKVRLAKGEKLEDTQLKKIDTENGVKKELEALNVAT